MRAVPNINYHLVIWLQAVFLVTACGNYSLEKLPDDLENESTTSSPVETIPTPPPIPSPVVTAPEEESDADEMVLSEYQHLDPNRLISSEVLKQAILYFHAKKEEFANDRVLSILDFNQSSTRKRFFVADLHSGEVWSLHVAHGKGSDLNHDGVAEKFSNGVGSNASSLGFYKTAETYIGKHGYSLRLDGLSFTNSKARSRAIVIHGASYVEDRSVIQGRSWGCPAISMANHKKLIDLIKGGSLIYAVGGN